MDFVESSKSQWAGRYSWGDEVQFNEGCSLTGQCSPTSSSIWAPIRGRFRRIIVNETRFGYTRFYNSTARELAGVARCGEGTGDSGLEYRGADHLGHSLLGFDELQRHLATIPKARTKTRTTRCSS